MFPDTGVALHVSHLGLGVGPASTFSQFEMTANEGVPCQYSLGIRCR